MTERGGGEESGGGSDGGGRAGGGRAGSESAGTGELLYPPSHGTKRDTPPVDAVRGFVFTSGRTWLEQHGVADRFIALLPERLRARIEDMAPTDWISVADALDVYAACDALGLSERDQIDLGRVVTPTNIGVVMSTLSAVAGRVGASPWFAMRHADRMWQRSNRGGGIAVFKVDERVARWEFWNVPLARSPFFVTSMRGAVAVGLEDFCDALVIGELPELTTSDSFALRVAW